MCVCETDPGLARDLVRILYEAQPFGMEHCLDTGEDADGDGDGLLVGNGVWDLPGNGRVGLDVLGKGTLVAVDTCFSARKMSAKLNGEGGPASENSSPAHLRVRYPRHDHRLLGKSWDLVWAQP